MGARHPSGSEHRRCWSRCPVPIDRRCWTCSEMGARRGSLQARQSECLSFNTKGIDPRNTGERAGRACTHPQHLTPPGVITAHEWYAVEPENTATGMSPTPLAALEVWGSVARSAVTRTAALAPSRSWRAHRKTRGGARVASGLLQQERGEAMSRSASAARDGG